MSNSHAPSPVLFVEAPGAPVFLHSPPNAEGDGAPIGATVVLVRTVAGARRLSARHRGVFLTAPGRALPTDSFRLQSA
jgi:hypothetical protein